MTSASNLPLLSGSLVATASVYPLGTVSMATLVVRGVQFISEKDNQPKPFTGPLLELVGRQHEVRESKLGMRCFSLVDYRPGTTRKNENIVQVNLIALDFDHLNARQTSALLEALAGRAYLLYSSHGHLAEGYDDNRFRAILVPTRPLQPKEYPVVWQELVRDLGIPADEAAKDVARIWFSPSCPAERRSSAIYFIRDGAPVDVDALLHRASTRTSSPTQPSARQPTSVSHWLLQVRLRRLENPEHRALMSKVLEGRSFAVEGFRDATLQQVVSIIAFSAPDVDEETVLDLLRPSLEEMRRTQPHGAMTEEMVREKLNRAIADAHAAGARPCEEQLRASCLPTDLGNARRLVQMHGEDLRYVRELDGWLVWSGQRWMPDERGELQRRARAVVETLIADAVALTKMDVDRGKKLMAHALNSQSDRALRALVSLAAAEPDVPMHPGWLDRDPYLLNCLNGTLDLRTGALHPHDRDELLTKALFIPYFADAPCPTWDAFLADIFEGSESLIRYVQRAIGYTLTGLTVEQVLFLLYGDGANGKSTFLNVLRSMLGDYAMVAPASTLMVRDAKSPTNDIARLRGARFVMAVETDGDKRLAEVVVKSLTGGDAVAVRYLYKEHFEFVPNFKIFLATNYKPRIQGSDEGIWRRVKLIPFNKRIPEERRDKTLENRLRAELPGILAWAVRGCLQWQREGLGEPTEVREATLAYREEMDPLGGFLVHCCERVSNGRVAVQAVYERYRQFCQAAGEPPLSMKAFNNHLRERGFNAIRAGANGSTVWVGLVLKP
ncbi:DNA primase family protein [Pyxidicoccus caerfyrddinensis]|uniref:DNA primase family protein n=1 Tax=Pyxidicoccus caerfyrddinensis TaxID=2709663 RepID=UPI0013D9D74E|nr:phage/plasmid primase, P4 family [Pyxidicoccus caerfyrddinensis]